MAITVATATALRSLRATVLHTNTTATLLQTNKPSPMIGVDHQHRWRPVCFVDLDEVAYPELIISCPEIAFAPKSNSHGIWGRGFPGFKEITGSFPGTPECLLSSGGDSFHVDLGARLG